MKVLPRLSAIPPNLLVPQVGLEPTTLRLSDAEPIISRPLSPIELLRQNEKTHRTTPVGFLYDSFGSTTKAITRRSHWEHLYLHLLLHLENHTVNIAHYILKVKRLIFTQQVNILVVGLKITSSLTCLTVPK